MPTQAIDITNTAWTNIGAAPMTIQAESTQFLVHIGTAAPTLDTKAALVFGDGLTEPFSIGGIENVYVRGRWTSGTIVKVTV